MRIRPRESEVPAAQETARWGEFVAFLPHEIETVSAFFLCGQSALHGEFKIVVFPLCRRRRKGLRCAA